MLFVLLAHKILFFYTDESKLSNLTKKIKNGGQKNFKKIYKKNSKKMDSTQKINNMAEVEIDGIKKHISPCPDCICHKTDEKHHFGVFSRHVTLEGLASVDSMYYTANMLHSNHKSGVENRISTSYAVEYLSDPVNSLFVYVIGALIQSRKLTSGYFSIVVQNVNSQMFSDLVIRVRKFLGPLVNIVSCNFTLRIYWDFMQHKIFIPKKTPKFLPKLESIHEDNTETEEDDNNESLSTTTTNTEDDSAIVTTVDVASKSKQKIKTKKTKRNVVVYKTALQKNKELLNQVKQELHIDFDFPPPKEISDKPVDLYFVSKFLHNKFKDGYMFTISSKLFNVLNLQENDEKMKTNGFKLYKHQQKLQYVVICPFNIKINK